MRFIISHSQKEKVKNRTRQLHALVPWSAPKQRARKMSLKRDGLIGNLSVLCL